MSERLTAKEILERQNQLKPEVIAARVDGQIYDLHTPLPADVKRVEPIHWKDPEGLEVIRHSTAHVMADAVQRLFPGTQVTIGPAVENGFYYDFDRPNGSFTEEDFAAIEAKMREIIASDFPFRREVMTRQAAHQLFESMGEKYKLDLLERALGEISVYRHGDWLDLCKGPHVPSTRFLGAVKLTSVAGAYWRGDERNPMLQRIYGTAFPSEAELTQYLADHEEAKKRDHRKLGKDLELVAFHPWAPASPFFLPRGAAVYNHLVDYVRALYRKFGYEEVITPQVYDKELFLKSGHLPSYADNMFLAATLEDLEALEANHAKRATGAAGDHKLVFEEVKEAIRFAIKPMNCPGHALLFGLRKHSYRELPWRMADFGRLHRYERSGVTQGLTRVRTFSQDDAHIFCTLEQVQNEIIAFLKLVHAVYMDFGFNEVRVVIATRPKERLGSDAVWDQSEQALFRAVEAENLPYTVAEGEGAFYGPKVEFHLKDALSRPWQLGTVQVDFNLPERFDLTYVGEDNQEHRPVMLHRAILGSVERFFGVLVEHCAGAFPTWLAPEQVSVLTVSEKFNDYAQRVVQTLKSQGIRAVADLSNDKLGAKIRNARLLRVPYLAVVGQKEVDGQGLAIRSRDEDKDLGFVALGAFASRVLREHSAPSLRSAIVS